MSEINALLLWRRLKPREEVCDDILCRRKMAYQLLHHSMRMAEKEESLALSRSRLLGIPGAPEHYMVKKPSGGRNHLKRLHCRYCDRKSAYSCACSP